ncbi:3'-5' exonuclease [Arthrobacter sp. JCM 19049]|uniref:3'-5' exonuclease n=1 Tax=Arthrobacter sp. JCM 19049 TaxID=1460643 RepID=UPI000B05ECE2|nr:3'-5' exonuclease [Arthrobacter sp. JCM 19049]
MQLLTIHASKGLEWDIVAVMSMNEGVFPDRTSDRWTSGDAALPWPLRGDRRDLPQWDTDQAPFLSCSKPRSSSPPTWRSIMNRKNAVWPMWR